MFNRKSGPLKVAVVAALGAFLIVPSVAGAAPARPPTSRATTGLSRFHNPMLSGHLLPASQRGLGLLRLTHPAAISGAPSREITSGQQLQIQLPANAQNVAQGTVTPADADNSKINFLGGFNDQTYTASGVAGGFEQVATLPIGTTTDTLDIEWLGTYYGSDAQALARVNETVKFQTSKNFQSVSCGTNCYGYALTFQNSTDNKTYVVLYTIFTSQNAVGELELILPQDILTADQTAVATLLGTLATAAFSAVGGQQQSGVSVEDFELLHKVHGKLLPTHSLKSSETGYVAVLVQDQSKDTSQLQATVTITSGGKTVHTATLRNLGVQSDGSILLSATFKVKTSKTKTYRAKAVAQDGSVQDMKSITFKVKKK